MNAKSSYSTDAILELDKVSIKHTPYRISRRGSSCELFVTH